MSFLGFFLLESSILKRLGETKFLFLCLGWELLDDEDCSFGVLGFPRFQNKLIESEKEETSECGNDWMTSWMSEWLSEWVNEWVSTLGKGGLCPENSHLVEKISSNNVTIVTKVDNNYWVLTGLGFVLTILSSLI